MIYTHIVKNRFSVYQGKIMIKSISHKARFLNQIKGKGWIYQGTPGDGLYGLLILFIGSKDIQAHLAQCGKIGGKVIFAGTVIIFIINNIQNIMKAVLYFPVRPDCLALLFCIDSMAADIVTVFLALSALAFHHGIDADNAFYPLEFLQGHKGIDGKVCTQNGTLFHTAMSFVMLLPAGNAFG